MITPKQMKVVKERIMRGQKAKLVIAAENFELAEKIFANLPPALRDRLTLVKAEV